MGQKDIAEKTLEAYNDVFADIVNVLLFNGEREIKEKDLEDATPVSIYKADGKFHSQERDIAKFWQEYNIRIAIYGLENQTVKDKTMPIRVMSYDVASYKQQIQDRKRPRKPLYPVVTLVLYFGNRRWEKPRSLFETMNVPDKLKSYISDYRINVFEIAYLSDEQVKMFKSDFRIVADYFVQMRKNKNYVPSKKVIKHVAEVLQLLKILTKDDKYEFNENFIKTKGEKMTMDRWLSNTIENSEKIGEKKGELSTIYKILKKGRITIEEAASDIGMTVEQLLAGFKEYNLVL